MALGRKGGLISGMNTHGKRSGFLSARLSFELGIFAYLRADNSPKDIQTAPPSSLMIFTTTTAATITTTATVEAQPPWDVEPEVRAPEPHGVAGL